MSTEMESKVNETIKNLENLETSQVQEAQQKILEELYAIREGLSKCRPTGEATLKELYSLRTTLMGEIQESRKMQNMLMRRTERVGHLKRNFKKMFDENAKLRKENEELKSAMKGTEEASAE